MFKKFAKQFALSINYDFCGHLNRAAKHHEEHQQGTWLSQRVIDTLIAVHHDTSNRVQVYCFELWGQEDG